jgi:hypothetical protein
MKGSATSNPENKIYVGYHKATNHPTTRKEKITGTSCTLRQVSELIEVDLCLRKAMLRRINCVLKKQYKWSKVRNSKILKAVTKRYSC